MTNQVYVPKDLLRRLMVDSAHRWAQEVREGREDYSLAKKIKEDLKLASKRLKNDR